MKKKIITIVAILFSLFHTIDLTAQEKFIIEFDIDIAQGENCNDHPQGLLWIKLHFVDGSSKQITTRVYVNEKATLKAEFSASNKVKEVEIYSNGNNKVFPSSCRVSDRTVRLPITSSSTCFYRIYKNDQVYASKINNINKFLVIKIYPKIGGILFSDRAVPITSTNTSCVGTGIGITAAHINFPDSVYNWEFYDDISFRREPSDKFKKIVKEIQELSIDLSNCDVSDFLCVNDINDLLADKRDELDALPLDERFDIVKTDRWVPISSLKGKPDTKHLTLEGLKLEDLYANKKDPLDPDLSNELTLFEKAIGKPIIIRIKNRCSWIGSIFEDVTNVLTVEYLNAPPKLKRKRVKQPDCSDGSAEITFVFDRNLRTGEDFYLNLLQKKAGGDYQALGSNILLGTDASPFVLNNGEWEYTYKRTKNIGTGNYQIDIGGYDVDTKLPKCLKTSDDFDVILPEQVTFTAVKEKDETCFEENDGQIKITALGGSGTYQYSLNNGVTWVSLPGSPYTVNNVSPGTYSIQVKDSNGCLDKEKLSDPDKRVSVTINEIDQITHTIASNGVTPPGAPGLSDASVLIQDISGGTPLSNSSNIDYYNYEVLINGSTVNTISGQISNGGTIIGLPAGNHKIKYTDVNLCVWIIDLPSIADPLPITFDIIKVDPDCSDSDDGELTVSNISGGYPPYTVTWQKDGLGYATGTSITGSQGDYNVVVTDARSGRTEQTSIRFDNVPLPITVSNIDIQPIKCFGKQAAVTITAAGGSSGIYQYALWNGINTVWQDSNTFLLTTNTTSGYQFRVRDRNNPNCISDIFSSGIITQPSEIIVTTSRKVDNTIFGGTAGSIDISVSGGTPNYIVNWERNGVSIASTGISINNLRAGTYVAIVRDGNGCSSRSEAIEISEPDPLNVSIMIRAGDTNINCHGDTTTLTANVTGGLGAYTYQWIRNGTIMPGEVSGILSNAGSGTYNVQVRDEYISSTSADFRLREPEALSLSVSAIDITCFEAGNGVLVLSPVGGTRPYAFSIDNRQSFVSEDDLSNLRIEGLRAGEYNVWMKDANDCEITIAIPVTIREPDAINITAEAIGFVTTIGGTNGSIAIGVSGGTGNHTYSWSRSGDTGFSRITKDIDNIPAGLYTVSVTDQNNCIAQETFEVKEPLPIEVVITETNPILCYGDVLGELLATVSGGFPIASTPADFEYRWYQLVGGVETLLNTDITLDKIVGLEAGTYKVIVNDIQGKTAERIFELIQPDDLIVTLNGDPTLVTCHGEATGAIDINVVGGAKDEVTGEYLPYTYKWTKEEDPDFAVSVEDPTGLTAGTYEVVIIDDNICTTSLPQKVIITEPNAPLEVSNVDIVNLTGFQTNNGSIAITLLGGTPSYTYEWRVDGSISIIGNESVINNLQAGDYELTIIDVNGCSLAEVYTVTEPTPLEISNINQTGEVLCFNDTSVTLEATAIGGVPSYQYSWYNSLDDTILLSTTNTLSDVSGGIYVVEVIDSNGNQTLSTYTVNQPEALIATYTTTNVSCNAGSDGSIDLLVTGGTGGYSFFWSNGDNTEDVSELLAGNYSVTVRDQNFCETIVDISITEPIEALYVSDTTILPVSGNGLMNGSISVLISGGTPAYSYQWEDINGNVLGSTTSTLNTIGTGNYFLTVTDSKGCILEPIGYSVSEPEPLIINVNETSIECSGETGELIANVTGGVEPYMYEWYDADNNLISDLVVADSVLAGTYSVVVTDANGNQETEADIILIQPEVLEINAVITKDVNCYGGTDGSIEIMVVGGTGSYIYNWSNSGSSTNIITGLAKGIYEGTVTDENGCSVSTNTIIINEPPRYDIIGVDLIRPSGTIGVNDGSIAIDIIGGVPPYEYHWTDNTGGTVQLESNTVVTSSAITGLQEGVYSILVTDAEGCIISDTYNLADPGELLVSVQQTQQVSCFGSSDGILEVITIGGVGGNTYEWYNASNNVIIGDSEVLRNVVAGSYYIVVSNAEGVTEQSAVFVVSQPDPVTGMLSAFQNSCFGVDDGSITIAAVGGNLEYEYRYRTIGSNYSSWIPFANAASTQISGLSTGFYEVQLMDTNGCFYEETTGVGVLRIRVTGPDELVLGSAQLTEPTGFGLSNGSINVGVRGGTPPYNYQWFDTNGILMGTTNILSGIGAGDYTIVVADANGCQTQQIFTLGEPTELMVDIEMVNIILCNQDFNGSIRAIAQGGVSNSYTYQWFQTGNNLSIGSLPLLENLGVGTYYVIIMDANGNTVQSSDFILSEPEQLTASLTADFTLCGDGNDWEINAEVSGGTVPYTYIWSNGEVTNSISNVTPGTYNLIVIDANGCQTSTNIDLDVPPAISVTENSIDTTCFGGADGSITISTSGGTGPYTYLWDNGETSDSISGLTSGVYEVVVTDIKGCELTQSYIVGSPEQLLVDLGDDVTLCVDQRYTIDATIADGVDYQWTSTNGFNSNDSSIEVFETGIYTVEVTNSRGCIATDSIFVDRSEKVISAEFIASTQVFVGEEFVVVNISDPKPDTLEWAFPEAAQVSYLDDNYAELAFNETGEYEITVKVNLGLCSATRTKKIVVIDKEFGEEQEEDMIDIETYIEYKVYPNPTANGQFVIDIELPEVTSVSLKIFNIINNNLVDFRNDQGKSTYQFSYDMSLPSGMYFILLETSSGSQVRKLIIE